VTLVSEFRILLLRSTFSEGPYRASAMLAREFLGQLVGFSLEFCLHSSTNRRQENSHNMATHLQLILENPAKLFWSIWQSLIYLFLVLIQRLVLPNACRAVTLRTEIARAILGSFLANFWDLLFKASPGLRDDEYLLLTAGRVPAVLVPPDRDLNTIGSQEDGKRKLLLLYSHGGGYFFGEPLMYMSTYKRWIKAMARENVELTVVSVDYRKSLYPR
jgi:hypothetical protein